MVIVSIFAQAASMVLLGWSPNYWVALLAMIVVGVSSGSRANANDGDAGSVVPRKRPRSCRRHRGIRRQPGDHLHGSHRSSSYRGFRRRCLALYVVRAGLHQRRDWNRMRELYPRVICHTLRQLANPLRCRCSLPGPTTFGTLADQLARSGLHQPVRLAHHWHGVLLRFRPWHPDLQLRCVPGGGTRHRRRGGRSALYGHRCPQHRQRRRIRSGCRTGLDGAWRSA